MNAGNHRIRNSLLSRALKWVIQDGLSTAYVLGKGLPFCRVSC